MINIFILFLIVHIRFGDKSAFAFQAAVLVHVSFFSCLENCVFFFVAGETFIPKGACRPWDLFSFGGKSELGM